MNDEQTQRHQQADALLKTVQQQGGGQLKIFLGAAPGVGKTCAMLNAAKELQQQGTAVCVGLVETHGRAETEALLQGCTLLPRKTIHYQNQQLTEFDVDAALALRPKIILVDELAHTNVPGSRHKRRYQDIAELLKAGINVYTTLNVQHIESLNDLVLQITGVRVQETVPDSFIDQAHEIVFIDLPPQNLIERLQQGKVYVAEYARSALEGFFSPANLTALRELAMKIVIEHVDDSLKTRLDSRGEQQHLVINDKLLVLISNRSAHEYLIRIGRRLAEKRGMNWLVVWVDTGQVQLQQDKARLQSAMTLAQELGARTEILRGPSTWQTIIPFIREERINTVLVGSGTRKWRWRKPLYQRLINSGLGLEVSVYRDPDQHSRVNHFIQPAEKFLPSARGYLLSILGVAVATLVAVLAKSWLHPDNLVLIYVVAVIISGLRFGAAPAVASAVVSFLSFNFFLTEPLHTLTVHNQDDITRLVFLVVIGLVCGPAASRIRRQFLLLAESNRYSESLQRLAEQFAVADDQSALWQALTKELNSSLLAETCIVQFNKDNTFYTFPTRSEKFTELDMAAIEWTRKQAAASGRFSDTLSKSSWSCFPIAKNNKTVAAILVRLHNEKTSLSAYDLDIINAMTQQAANAWQRIYLTKDLESARVKAEIEQLRSALLSSVSHDLRSPLSAMIGAADSLRLLDQQLSIEDRSELIDTILQESRRLDRYIQNLLDMTRLGHGTLKIERDWVSASDIIGSALTRLKRYSPEALIEFRVNGTAPLLYAHAALIEQAVFNILENAAKFTPPGEKITVTLEQINDICTINIEDKGPGIPEDLREKIFDMFYVVSDGDHKKNNTGMGLAICKGMIAAHGGSVTALEGSQKTGTRFLVEIPLPLNQK
ncbi:sensor histidine kinase KdpD [Cellvibrio sp. KY-YJ-3]|uniref:sensor histidine kinase n=1 Tax=Cellvibrio sp. KY-YJ-3 TaxID=454662 RepID=UPI0012442D51|nr:sensor histidine kinase KdpD [Cellvibrio sp. KY-YJ-3]QEY13952.1 sensor histidine kinase KdpD [Cellvibrio sp. KY-YJ-3]